eukprot:CAMPEP_0181492728 /NCGR_PEP_ID=MMETSP1110-20121109/50844_1 /TAXON_ID=174948 /ORGANISM="Symbiodinium sp., Strain CCMP421" /LENGTH=171 /DNA_ID=CAMNT_0023619995 /DNA_START=283 /DNA_END=798 /DNA_ORIENTATION=+
MASFKHICFGRCRPKHTERKPGASQEAHGQVPVARSQVELSQHSRGAFVVHPRTALVPSKSLDHVRGRKLMVHAVAEAVLADLMALLRTPQKELQALLRLAQIPGLHPKFVFCSRGMFQTNIKVWQREPWDLRNQVDEPTRRAACWKDGDPRFKGHHLSSTVLEHDARKSS